jgi:hypothetical protein
MIKDFQMTVAVGCLIIISLVSIIMINFVPNEVENNQINPLITCQSDNDCIPQPGCHALSCINAKFESNFEQPEICTTLYSCSSAYSKDDCSCRSGFCVNQNLKRSSCE